MLIISLSHTDIGKFSRNRPAESDFCVNTPAPSVTVISTFGMGNCFLGSMSSARTTPVKVAVLARYCLTISVVAANARVTAATVQITVFILTLMINLCHAGSMGGTYSRRGLIQGLL